MVDDRRRVVLLFLGGNAFALIEDQVRLGCGGLALLRLGNGGDIFCGAAGFDDLLGRLALRVQLPVADRILVRRVEDWPFEESVVHSYAVSRLEYNS